MIWTMHDVTEEVPRELLPQTPDDNDPYDRGVASALEEIRKVMLVSDLTQRDVERHNGWSRGYLNQVLCGHITFTVRHLYGVLGALEIPLTRFFGHMDEKDAERRRKTLPISEGP